MIVPDTISGYIRPPVQQADRITLTLPSLPPAMEGKTILHLTDFHIRRYRPWFRRLIERCAHMAPSPDFVCMTGDYMSIPRDEPKALRVMADLIDVLNPRLGFFASFGNHDSEALKRLARTQLSDKVTWLEQESAVIPELGVTFLGTSTPCDLVTTILHARTTESQAGFEPDSDHRSYRILLGHEPTILITGAELGIEWSMLGHTHGGQVRTWLPRTFMNSSRMPGEVSSGIIRLRNSIGTISRGLGESYYDIRLLCPPQLPLYELHKGPLPGAFQRRMYCVRWW